RRDTSTGCRHVRCRKSWPCPGSSVRSWLVRRFHQTFCCNSYRRRGCYFSRIRAACVTCCRREDDFDVVMKPPRAVMKGFIDLCHFSVRLRNLYSLPTTLPAAASFPRLWTTTCASSSVFC